MLVCLLVNSGNSPFSNWHILKQLVIFHSNLSVTFFFLELIQSPLSPINLAFLQTHFHSYALSLFYMLTFSFCLCLFQLDSYFHYFFTHPHLRYGPYNNFLSLSLSLPLDENTYFRFLFLFPTFSTNIYYANVLSLFFSFIRHL